MKLAAEMNTSQNQHVHKSRFHLSKQRQVGNKHQVIKLLQNSAQRVSQKCNHERTLSLKLSHRLSILSNIKRYQRQYILHTMLLPFRLDVDYGIPYPFSSGAINPHPNDSLISTRDASPSGLCTSQQLATVCGDQNSFRRSAAPGGHAREG